MRRFQHRERQEAIESGEPLIHAGSRAGEQQHCSGEERQRSGDLRYDGRDVNSGQLVRAGKAAALRSKLLRTEQYGAEEERNEVVHRSIRE